MQSDDHPLESPERRRPPARHRPVAPDGYGDTDHDDQEGLPVEIPTVPQPPAGED